MAFLEQDVARFLAYYPSGGHDDTLARCHALFGIATRQAMQRLLEAMATDASSRICLDADKACFAVAPRLSLAQQRAAFAKEQLARLDTCNTNGEYLALFTSCLASECRVLFDVRALKRVFWSWCHAPQKDVCPALRHFSQMGGALLAKYEATRLAMLGRGRDAHGYGKRYLEKRRR